MRRFAMPLLLTWTVLIGLTLSAAHAQGPAGRKFVIYFQEWSADIDETARGVIIDAAQHALSVPRTAVQVTGFADPIGSRRANALLSELRAQRVVDMLGENGVSQTRTQFSGKGSVPFALSTQEARRVEIFVPVR